MTYHRLKHHPERRVHKRIPVLTKLIEPITIKSPQLHLNDPIPGFMGNLSAGGMQIATFIPLPENHELEIAINIPGIHNIHIHGKIKRTIQKHGSYLITFHFTHIAQQIKEHINKMAEDFEMCVDRKILGVRDFCYSRNCHYHNLCTDNNKIYSKHRTHD